jgi:hypothetical protein
MEVFNAVLAATMSTYRSGAWKSIISNFFESRVRARSTKGAGVQ